MTSATHTPGPWSYGRNPENTRWIIDSEPGRAVAVTAGYEPDSEANARLISCAPETLAELEAVIGFMRNAQIDLSVSTKKQAAQTLNRGIARAQAALAKARGQ